MKVRQNITKDRNGTLEGLPLELLIIILIMGISLPIIWNSAQYYSQQQLEKDVKIELDILEEKIEEVAYSEQGNIRIYKIDLKDNFLSDIDYVKIGGEKKEKMNVIRYKIGENNKNIILDDILISNFTDNTACSLNIKNRANIFIRYSDFSLDGKNIIEIGFVEGMSS